MELEPLVNSLKPRVVTFEDAVVAYIADRRDGRASEFETCVRRMVDVLPEAAGNKLVESYDRQDARAVMRLLLSRGLKTATVRRRLSSIHAVLEHAYGEGDMLRRNPFSRLSIPGEGKDAKKRGTFSAEELESAYKMALTSGSEIRLLVPLLGETGARLAEIVGLRVSDVCLTSEAIRITPDETTQRCISTLLIQCYLNAARTVESPYAKDGGSTVRQGTHSAQH